MVVGGVGVVVGGDDLGVEGGRVPPHTHLDLYVPHPHSAVADVGEVAAHGSPSPGSACDGPGGLFDAGDAHPRFTVASGPAFTVAPLSVQGRLGPDDGDVADGIAHVHQLAAEAFP